MPVQHSYLHYIFVSSPPLSGKLHPPIIMWHFKKDDSVPLSGAGVTEQTCKLKRFCSDTEKNIRGVESLSKIPGLSYKGLNY